MWRRGRRRRRIRRGLPGCDGWFARFGGGHCERYGCGGYNNDNTYRPRPIVSVTCLPHTSHTNAQVGGGVVTYATGGQQQLIGRPTASTAVIAPAWSAGRDRTRLSSPTGGGGGGGGGSGSSGGGGGGSHLLRAVWVCAEILFPLCAFYYAHGLMLISIVVVTRHYAMWRLLMIVGRLMWWTVNGSSAADSECDIAIDAAAATASAVVVVLVTVNKLSCWRRGAPVADPRNVDEKLAKRFFFSTIRYQFGEKSHRRSRTPIFFRLIFSQKKLYGKRLSRPSTMLLLRRDRSKRVVLIKSVGQSARAKTTNYYLLLFIVHGQMDVVGEQTPGEMPSANACGTSDVGGHCTEHTRAPQHTSVCAGRPVAAAVVWPRRSRMRNRRAPRVWHLDKVQFSALPVVPSRWVSRAYVKDDFFAGTRRAYHHHA